MCFAQQPIALPMLPGFELASISPPNGIVGEAFGQRSGQVDPPDTGPDLNMPKAQRDAMIKADHRKNLDDAVALLRLAEELKSNLEKEDPLIVSIKNIKQTEDIQKIAKRIQGRLKHD
jgi:hypothetical protein